MSSKAEEVVVSKNSGTGTGSLLMGVIVFIFIFLIVLLILGTCTETGRGYVDKFKDKIMPKKSKLKELDVLMFMLPTCPFCVKTMEVLEKEKELNNLTIIDVSKEEGKKIAEQYGASKLPSFISRKMGTSAVGSIEHVSDLVKALTSVKTPEPRSSDEPQVDADENVDVDINIVNQLQIVLFAREGCSWCLKAKDECERVGVLNSIKIIDITTPEGQQAASELLPKEITGVPAWVSLSTRKVSPGYKPFSQLLKELQ